MANFRSNEEFFKAVDDLAARLEVKGHHQAAATLRDGFRSLNGLTDGVAAFVESIESLQAGASGRLEPEDRRALEEIRAVARAAACRR